MIEAALRDPKQLRYRAEGLAASGRVLNLQWSTKAFGVEGTAEEASVAGLRLTTSAIAPAGEAARQDAEGTGEAAAPTGGTLAVDGRVPFTEKGTFDLTVKGDLALAAGEALVPDSRLGGQASLEARVGGTLSAPDLAGTFGIVGGRARHGAMRVSALQVTGRFAGREAIVDRASARVLGGQLLASGSVPLAALDAGRVARLTFEATDVDLARLAVPFAERTPDTPSFLLSLSGELEAGGAGARGPARPGAVHAARVEDERGHDDTRRPRGLAPRRGQARAGARCALRDRSGPSRRAPRRRSSARRAAPSSSPAPSTCAS